MRFFQSATALLAASGAALAAPLNKAKRTASAADIQTLQFLHMMEEFEATYYLEGLSAFSAADFSAAGWAIPDLVLENLLTFATDQSNHIQFWGSVLESVGSQPISTCAFHFEPVLTDVATWLQFGREMEYIGMGALMSALTMLDSPEMLLDVTNIVTVEARHQTLFNIFNGAEAVTQSYDAALTPSQLLAMAGQFITGCEIFPMDLPMVPQVTHLFAGMPAGLALNWTWGNATTQTVNADAFWCQWTSGTATDAVVQPITQCVSPAINGYVFAWITNSSTPLTTDITTQNVNNVVAGPAIAFVDSQKDILSELAVTGTADVNDINTISSAQAAALMGSSNGTMTTASGTVVA
ncbi:hypothetical protein DACRYDRAFT_113158 [Dacryopinax primogenitus]|uniref:Ferritin-like domain-containing protein n=1 Tax=Dacryopinax primogenitus (strain DJM 731) TaxID=1858805 RepID=M5G8B4_DACPD|nr:uncharacterized protein DACRYDRAFT_113158 [Dacryopinax primogenitus]EJU06456.1 hypothetical protein DACRYDRAFT_113158 [Dacryopinax primogenitus]